MGVTLAVQLRGVSLLKWNCLHVDPIDLLQKITQCTCCVSHKAPLCNRNMHTCAHFCYKMVHCGIFYALWDLWDESLFFTGCTVNWPVHPMMKISEVWQHCHFSAVSGREKINGFMQDCSNSSVLAMELLQSCTKPSTLWWKNTVLIF